MSRNPWRILFVSALLGLAPTAGGAMIKLTNVDGGGDLFIDVGLSVDMQIRVVTSPADSVSIHYINAFLDTAGMAGTQVTAVNGAVGWSFDRTFSLPAEIDEGYFLVSGTDVIDGGYPPGSADYIHDTLTLTQTTASSDILSVTFETGGKAPQFFGPAPTYIPFPVAPPGFPPGIANFLYVGDELSNNPEFLIYQGVPEPATIGWMLMAFVLRRGRRIRLCRSHRS